MSKFQEDHYYFIYEELNKDENLKALFNKNLDNINTKKEYRFSSPYEKYEVSFNESKKELTKKS